MLRGMGGGGCDCAVGEWGDIGEERICLATEGEAATGDDGGTLCLDGAIRKAVGIIDGDGGFDSDGACRPGGVCMRAYATPRRLPTRRQVQQHMQQM
jgi:hypothetical protein